MLGLLQKRKRSNPMHIAPRRMDPKVHLPCVPTFPRLRPARTGTAARCLPALGPGQGLSRAWQSSRSPRFAASLRSSAVGRSPGEAPGGHVGPGSRTCWQGAAASGVSIVAAKTCESAANPCTDAIVCEHLGATKWSLGHLGAGAAHVTSISGGVRGG